MTDITTIGPYPRQVVVDAENITIAFAVENDPAPLFLTMSYVGALQLVEVVEWALHCSEQATPGEPMKEIRRTAKEWKEERWRP